MKQLEREERRRERAAREARVERAARLRRLAKWGAALALGMGIIWGGYRLTTVSVAPIDATALAVTDADWIRGKREAPVTLVEYSDFQCPACAAYAPIVRQVEAAFPDTLRLVFRHYPLAQIHANAIPAARAAEAAGRQGKFFEMHDMLFVNQRDWSTLADPGDTFARYAEKLGLDMDGFRSDITQADLDKKIDADRATGDRLKIRGTPTFYLNGAPLENPASLDAFKAAVQKALDAARS